jgi:hypothetical protein
MIVCVAIAKKPRNSNFTHSNTCVLFALGRWENSGLKHLSEQLDELRAKFNGTKKAREDFCRTWVKIMVDETEIRQQWRAQEDIINDLKKFGELKDNLMEEVTKVLAKRAGLLGETELIVALKFLSAAPVHEVTKVLKMITKDAGMQHRLLVGIKTKVNRHNSAQLQPDVHIILRESNCRDNFPSSLQLILTLLLFLCGTKVHQTRQACRQDYRRTRMQIIG